MSNIIKFSINGDTNADQVTEKVKKSVSALEKNMEGIQTRFKNFGKDLFLSFAAPMVLLNTAINMVSASIEKNRQAIQDAKASVASGENPYAREGTVGSAREVERRRKDALDRKNAKLGAEAYAREQGQEGGVAGFGGEADKAMVQYLQESTGIFDYLRRNAKASLNMFGLSDYTKDTEMQDVLERRSASRVSASPEEAARLAAVDAQAKQKEAAESQIAAQKKVDSMPTSFKGPEGFSNVVGVGANPVLEAMSAQLDEVKKTNELLAQLITPVRTNGWLDAPAGATSTAAPSRAAMLKGK